jgi:hypothetical protein
MTTKKTDAMNYCDPAASPKAAVNDHPADKCLEAYCERCNRAVDAVCPGCRENVRDGGTPSLPGGTEHGPAQGSVLSRAEFYRRFITLIQNARNAKFELGCYLIATGDAYADGVSMTEFAREWGVGKATVSKRCKIICAYLGIEPNRRYMRDEATAEKFRESNRRPRRVEG